MTRNVKLTDIQLILLSTAAQRENGSLLPPPETLGQSRDRILKAVATLIKRALAEEVELAIDTHAWRHEGDHAIGVIITDAGRAAIGLISPAGDVEPSDPIASATIQVRAVPSPRAGTRQAQLVDMLEQPNGVTLDDIVAATGWLPHTSRAALTGLRKRGFVITREQIDGLSRYRVSKAA